VSLAAHGIRIELPRGWSGRVFSRQAGVATLHVANYPLALSDGEFGDRSTASMRPGACFVAMTEYRSGGGLQPGAGLFSTRRLALPLDPTSFSVRALAHPRPGQAGTQRFLTLAERPFCLYVVLAGERATRRHQLGAVDHLLRSLDVQPRHR
jgi:hypothetical protein